MRDLGCLGCLTVGLALLWGCGSDPEPVTITAEVRSFDGDPDNSEPVELVQVCELNTSDIGNCDTTDADGKFELTLPGESEVALTLVKEGFGPTLVSDVTDSDLNTGQPTILIPTEEWVQQFAEDLGTQFPDCEDDAIVCANGLALISTRDGLRREDEPIPGISYELLVGEGNPYYLSDDVTPDTSLEATQAPGAGGFFEMTEIGKTHEVRVSGWDGSCRAAAAWPGKSSDTIRFQVLDRFLTQVTVVCE